MVDDQISQHWDIVKTEDHVSQHQDIVKSVNI